MPSFNFQHVEAELRTMAANDFVGDASRQGPRPHARVRWSARDGPGGGVRGGWGQRSRGRAIQSSAGVTRGRPRAAHRRRRRSFKQFRGIQLLITDEEVEVAVEKHPQKPAGLPELLVHEGVRTATGF